MFSPKDATAIVMDPRSGAILAMANWPQVNANDPASSSPEALQNRAVGFDYEPGSTFKAFTVAGALQQGLVKPTSSFYIPDKIQVADRTIHDDTEHGDETLTTAQILAQSSNVGAIKIGALEGKSDFSSWVSRFGFGKRTGVELPGEELGQVLPVEQVLGLLDGQPADRPGPARHAAADGQRLLGDRQRRHPAPAAHHRSRSAASRRPSRRAAA